jgi:hypothetical protein
MTIPQDQRSPHQQQRWVELYNVGGYEIPAYGACEVLESSRPEQLTAQTPDGGRTVLHVQRPSQDGLSGVVLNGPMPIAPGASCAVGTNDYPAYARWAAPGSPVPGEIWGTVADQFHLGRGRQGFAVAGDVDAATGLMRVFRQERLHRVEIDSEYALLPGGDQLARVLAYNYSTHEWDQTDTRMVTLRDPLCRAFALPGEKLWAEQYGAVGDDDQFQVVGEFGLHRRVRILSDVVNPNETCTVEVISNDYQEACTEAGVWELEVCYRGSQVLFAGQEGEIFYHPELKRWHLMVSGNSSRIIRFQMTTTLPLGGKGTAVEVGTGPAYVPVGAPFPIKDGTEDPGRFRDDYGGYIGYCYLPSDPELDGNGDAYREILHMEQIARSITFTTLYDAVPVKLGGGAIVPPTATRFGPHSVLCRLDEYYLGKDPSDVLTDEFAIYDPQGQFPRSLAGAKGKARYNDREHRYEMVVCDQQADKVQAYFDELCASTLSITDDSQILPWSHPPYGQRPAPEAEESNWISNKFGLGICGAGIGLMVWSEVDEKYVVIQVPHITESVAAGIRVNTDDCTIELLRKNVIVMACDTATNWGCGGTVSGCGSGDPDDWCIVLDTTTMIESFSVVDGAGTCVISANSRTVCVLDTGGGSSSSTVVTFSPLTVLTDVYASGTSIYAAISTIYTPCSDLGTPVELIAGYCCDAPCCCHQFSTLGDDPDAWPTLTAVFSGGVLSGSIDMSVTSGSDCVTFDGSGGASGCGDEYLGNVDLTLYCDSNGDWQLTITGGGANCAFGTPSRVSSDCGPPFQVVFDIPLTDILACGCTPHTATLTITED